MKKVSPIIQCSITATTSLQSKIIEPLKKFDPWATLNKMNRLKIVIFYLVYISYPKFCEIENLSKWN